jgi:hypothetical protein
VVAKRSSHVLPNVCLELLKTEAIPVPLDEWHKILLCPEALLGNSRQRELQQSSMYDLTPVAFDANKRICWRI